MNTIRNVLALILAIAGVILTINLIRDFTGKHVAIYFITAPVLGFFIYMLYNKQKS